MKMIYAGQGESEKPFDQLLYNCTRNQKCQRPFYVPVKEFSDIVLYFDLGNLGTDFDSTTFEVMNVCDIAVVGSFIPGEAVVGITTSGSTYMVLGGFVVTPPVGVDYSRFFFKVTVEIAGQNHVFYSQQYEFPVCEELVYVRGCYPNEEGQAEAFDCNGIWYGYPTTEDFLGDENYKYIHSGYVRQASIIEQRNRMTLTAFNSKKIYKNVFNREWLFEFELVPGFYKDHMIGIFNRGNVQVDGVEWKLADTQDITIVDIDSKLWRMDMIFDSECKQLFGCAPADCAFRIPPPPCEAVDFEPESSPELPEAYVGIPYSYSFNIVGTPPFNLIVNDEPDWMTIAIVGNTVTFTGTPEEEAELFVDILIRNCDNDNSITFDQSFAAVEYSGQLIVTSTESTLSVVGIVGVIHEDIIYPVTATVQFGIWRAFTGGNIQVNLSVQDPGFARLLKNGVQIDIQPFTALQGFVTFTGVAAFANTDVMEINVKLI